MLTARHDVRLGLHRLRVEGGLTEIRAGDLTFTLAEAGELFTAPRPHPTSSTCSSPRRPSSSSSSAQIARLPGPVEYR